MVAVLTVWSHGKTYTRSIHPMASPDHLATAARAARAIRRATDARNAAIVAARDAGATWRAIALATGLTEPGVLRIYRRAKSPSTTDTDT